jgi:hypothetical protein
VFVNIVESISAVFVSRENRNMLPAASVSIDIIPTSSTLKATILKVWPWAISASTSEENIRAGLKR